jgi:hypothetical protein
MIYRRHALDRMKERGILRADADAVVLAPTKRALGRNGATNYWGMNSNGLRIRVTVAADQKTVVTVAWADERSSERDSD